MQNIVFIAGTIRGETAWPYLFAKGLSEAGFNVTVISGYANINVSEEYREHQLANPVEDISSTLRIIRVGSRNKDPHGLLGRGIKYIQLTRDLSKEVKKHKADCYLFYSTPPFLGLIGEKMARKGQKTVYIAQDLFPDSLFAAKPGIEQTIMGSLLRKLEKRIYDGNTKIITISKMMACQIENNKSEPGNIEVIYNWANVDSLRHVNREENPLFDEYEIDREKFIISYAGSFGPLQKLDLLLDAAKELKDIPNIQFVLFGRGVCKESLLNRIKTEDIHNVTILPMQPSEKVSEVYSFGDIEYVSVNEGVMKIASPHKILDVFSVASPILAAIDKDSDIAQVINHTKIGVVVSPIVPEIKEGILQLYNRKEHLSEMGMKARKYAETISYKSQIRLYADFITNVIITDV